MQHRSEIDGLRAVAVIPVVLFHAGLPALPGGYIGVDVFFVISGYLITSIILDGVSRGTFTFRDFYERRARRILPALFVMLAVTSVAAWFILLPPAFRHFGISAAAVALFASNIYFLRTTDYFETPAEVVPLIHTWSLGVEEQFYLVFPILAVLVPGRHRAVILMALLLLASLSLAHGMATVRPAAAFYLLPTRGWELLAGSLVAYGTPTLAVLRRGHREMLALAGLAGVVGSYLLYDRSTPFPSLYATLPVAGTALVIAFATTDTWVGRMLSWRPLTFIGLSSYSTYLWHQPLFAFARHLSLNELRAETLAMLSVSAFVLGAVSWRFIERPFRDRAWLTRAQVFALAAGASVLALSLGVAAFATNGLRSRFDDKILALLYPKHDWLTDPCHRSEFTSKPMATSCVLGDARNVVGALIGDSHAAAIAQGLGASLAASGIGLLQLTFNGCPPIPDVYRTDMGLAQDCAGFNREVRAFLEKFPSLRHVLVVSRWTRFINSTGFDNGEGGVETSRDHIAHLSDGQPLPLADRARIALVVQKAASSTRALLDLGKYVVLVYPIPEVGWDAPVYLARRELRRRAARETVLASTSFDAFRGRNRATFAMLDEIGEHPRLTRVYPHREFCDTSLPERCVFEQDSQSLYTDNNHVSLAGARLLAPEIVRAITRGTLEPESQRSAEAAPDCGSCWPAP